MNLCTFKFLSSSLFSVTSLQSFFFNASRGNDKPEALCGQACQIITPILGFSLNPKLRGERRQLDICEAAGDSADAGADPLNGRRWTGLTSASIGPNLGAKQRSACPSFLFRAEGDHRVLFGCVWKCVLGARSPQERR